MRILPVRKSLYWKKLLHAAHNRVQRQVLGRTGIDVMDEDWDNLVVLDACRYDVFAAHNSLSGDLQRVTSAASSTPQWAIANFDGRSFPDTVYVLSNENVLQADAEFHDVIPLYDDEYRMPLWPEEYEDPTEVVDSAAVVEETLRAQERYPNKRLIVHFMVPHSPHRGETGRELFVRDRHWYRVLQENPEMRDQYWQAYLENVDIALDHAEELVPQLEGKTVVTADHGEMFGRLGIYEHPPSIFTKELVGVPWFVAEHSSRKTITEGRTVRTGELTPELREHLADLGYASPG